MKQILHVLIVPHRTPTGEESRFVTFELRLTTKEMREQGIYPRGWKEKIKECGIASVEVPDNFVLN